MKFPHTLSIRQILTYDDFGQVLTTTEKPFSCYILSEIKTQKKTEKGRKNNFDMRIIVSARTYSPYSTMFEDNDARCIYEDIVYEITENNKINSFSGKPRYYEMALKKVVEL